MNVPVFYTAGKTEALRHAATQLQRFGCNFASRPDSSVTHLLLDVPSFEPDGKLKGGELLCDVLNCLTKNVTVFGGNISRPELEGYAAVDLLKDPYYLAQNANITAHCALQVALPQLPVIPEGCHVLVIGWGRIGKCLARLLKQQGAIVTVAARKESDRAMLLSLGYDTEDSSTLGYSLLRYRIIFNTVPEMILTKGALVHCRPDCLKVDLASVQGIEADDVLWARGLPGKYAPETSGELIARSILRYR